MFAVLTASYAGREIAVGRWAVRSLALCAARCGVVACGTRDLLYCDSARCAEASSSLWKSTGLSRRLSAAPGFLSRIGAAISPNRQSSFGLVSTSGGMHRPANQHGALWNDLVVTPRFADDLGVTSVGTQVAAYLLGQDFSNTGR